MKIKKEKILLELKGLKRGGKDSLRISSELNDFLIRLLSEKIKKEKKG